jgi:hypothetical protein
MAIVSVPGTLLRLTLDWLMLWLLIVHAPGFAIPDNQLWWRVVSFLSLDKFMAGRVSGGALCTNTLNIAKRCFITMACCSQGYSFFLACFYLFIGGMVLVVALALWVGHNFLQNRFDTEWCGKLRETVMFRSWKPVAT